MPCDALITCTPVRLSCYPLGYEGLEYLYWYSLPVLCTTTAVDMRVLDVRLMKTTHSKACTKALKLGRIYRAAHKNGKLNVK